MNFAGFSWHFPGFQNSVQTLLNELLLLISVKKQTLALKYGKLHESLKVYNSGRNIIHNKNYKFIFIVEATMKAI